MSTTTARRRPSIRGRHGVVVAAIVAPIVLGLGLPPGTAAGAPQVSSDPAVVRDWNALAWRTISGELAPPPPVAQPPQVAQLYLGLVSLAVHNAVVTVEGGGTPTLPQRRAHAHASSDVAAATAAYDVLRHFFPTSSDGLTAAYEAWLAGVPNGVGRVHGLRVGHDAAAALIASRAGDGRGAAIPLPDRSAALPGDWVPTTPGAEFQAPWLGFTRPLLIDSPTRFTVDGPDPLDSRAYAEDVEEVRSMGALTGSDRLPDETATALFWSDSPPRQYQDAMRDRSVRHGMDIVATARMFAAANAAGADALITCWRLKYDENLWRPVTAIQRADTDGNPGTTADPAWQPLRPTPPYPDYTSGHACVSGAVARALENLFGPGEVDVDIRNAASGAVRHFDTEDAWLDEVVNARIWLGFHFRDAMDDGRSIGNQVADHVVDGWFSVG